jgi:DNA topoisomerase I
MQTTRGPFHSTVSKDLIIVESPAKTRTLKKFLGGRYAVEASMGHVRDLVKKDLGIGPGFEPHYEVLKEKREVVAKLKKAAKGAATVYLAPDPDREGEAIAWHIAEILDRDPESVRRVTFNEITRRAVLKALEQPRTIDYRKVDAQQARRILDRLMGFKLSPLLWEKVKQGLSAGRVQSVALKMVCDRQAEIDAFVAEEYWLIDADLAADQPPQFRARLAQIDGRKAKVDNGEQASAIVADLERDPFRVLKVERKESQQRPGPPFITSRLQQEAARRFGFAVKRTMALAQGLYEGREIGDRGAIGLITYMRTDSTRVAEEALTEVRGVIAATYGEKALPEKPNFYRSKKGAQDAHEAIRPTTFDLPPDQVAAYLKRDELKLYKLIWDRFLASQMLPAVFDVTQVDVECGRYVLRASGKVMKSPGFLALYRDEPDPDDAEAAEKSGDALPPVTEGQALERLKIASEQKFTQPPPLYSEATLVKALEENGIGRPSTYAQILATLSDRSYAEKLQARFRPTPLGQLVNRLLQSNFDDIINEGYTASLEQELDRIEDGELGWKQALTSFDEKFSRDLVAAGKAMPNVKREGVPTDEICPDCGSPLVMRFGRYGSFLGCTNYPTCSYTRDVGVEGASEQGKAAEEEVPPCEVCGRPMALRRSRFGTFYGCTGYPECKNIRRTGPPRAEPKDTGVACPQCGEGTLVEKRSRRGKVFYSCSRYPKCDFALWNKPMAKPCPQCGAPFLVEKTTKKDGTRLLCNDKECGYSEPAPAAPAPAEDDGVSAN